MEQFINILLDRLEEKTITIANLESEIRKYQSDESENIKSKDADIRYLKRKVERLEQGDLTRNCDYVDVKNENERLTKELDQYKAQCYTLSTECIELRAKLQNVNVAQKPNKRTGNKNVVPPSMREEAPALQDAGFLFIKPDEPRMFHFYEDIKTAARETKENYLSIKFAPKNGKLIGGLEVSRAKQRDELIDGKKVFDILDPVTGENTLRYYASDGHMDTILADA